MYVYYQIEGGEEPWKPVQEEFLPQVTAQKHPMFVTVLSVDKIVTDEMARADKLSLKYAGPMYFDFDSQNINDCIADLKSLCKALEHLEVPLEQLQFFATGSKGFHVELPMELFMLKMPKGGVTQLPLIYKQIAMHFAEDTLDWRVYSASRGRMWRQVNVQRPNGKYKVPLTVAQVKELTADSVVELTSHPTLPPKAVKAQAHLELCVLFDKAQQEVEERIKQTKKRKPAPAALFKNPLPSLDLLMEGKGVRAGAGFNQIAMQLAIYCREAGIEEDELVRRCAGLIANHESDGVRYNTPARREAELRRMHQVVWGDPTYDFSVGAVKVLLNHTAPDLEGITVDRATIEEEVLEVGQVVEGEEGDASPDEYGDVARQVQFSRYGMYGQGEFGKERICAVSFDNVVTMRSMENNKISCVSADVMVNGRRSGRQTLELETFHTSSNLNKFTARYGHAFQGTEQQAKAAYMRLVEKSRKAGTDVFVHEREGLSLVNIPHHPDERLREPFLLWADAKEVVLEPRVRDSGISVSFQGSPDPRGVFKSDMTDAPGLKEFVSSPENKEEMNLMLQNLFRCQKPDMLGPTLGWMTACFYKALFQKAYNQFPLLHINGFAGSGKSQMTQNIARMFYYNQDATILTPNSTVFALGQAASGSDSIPMVIDEYKPHEMRPGMHDQMKLMFRDAYNARSVQRGGGNRDNDNFKALTTTTLSAPMAFIAEAIEEETALMERVVLVTMAPPPSVVAYKWASRFHAFRNRAQLLAVIGKYIASKIVLTGYNHRQLMNEFDPMYLEARQKLMLTEEDLSAGLSTEHLRDKQAARERSVFNFTVAKFGLTKFQEVVEGVFGQKAFAEDFQDLHAHAYFRMKDLAPSTMPEYLKVLNVLVELSYENDLLPQAIRYGQEYAFGELGGKDTLEFYARAAYARYRQHCRLVQAKPLYSGEDAFVHSLRNAPALLNIGEAQNLWAAGGVHVFDLNELLRMGLRGFKVPKRNKDR